MDKQFTLPYGKSELLFGLPAELKVEILSPNFTPPAADPLQTVIKSLAAPVDGINIQNFSNRLSVAIAINDKTRPVPHEFLLPPLLQILERQGIPSQAVKIIIATGAHPVMDSSEFSLVVPKKISETYPVICHDAKDDSNLVFLGTSKQGTPIWINRHFTEADLRIVVGNIAPHQFQGYSGGAKSAVIGLAGIQTINHNHAMMKDPNACLGEFNRNPTRQDIEEIGRIIDIHYALNVVLTDNKEIVHVLSGQPAAVMEAGIPLVNRIYQIPARYYDLVVASPGGYPKDINLYQAQKGLAHARLVTRDGGTIIIAAECQEGSGSQKYQDWVTQTTSHQQVIDKFTSQNYRLGAHKAYQISRDLININHHLYSSMEPDFVRSLLLHPVQDFQQTITNCTNKLSSGASIGIMPYATSTIPVIQS